MADQLIIADLEFETIKTNLKTFLNSQSQFLDFNFEGSSLAVLINLLAYNTYYNAFYTNMIANELFIDSAQVRNSLLSHAKALNYVPVSRRAPTAIVNITVTPPIGNTQSSLVLDRFTQFQSQSIDGINYTFVTTQATTAIIENGTFPFTNVQIKGGTPQVVTFTFNPTLNPTSQFELPNDDIDTSTLLVTVQTSLTNTAASVFPLSSDITQLTSNSQVYFLTTSSSNKYKLTFGDGNVSAALSNGNIIIASYLTTDGTPANQANSFATGSIGGFSNVIVQSVSAGVGGADRESNDSIRAAAPLAYTAQGRAVTQKDYETLLKQLYSGIQSIFVWGGEDNIPPVFGQVFISIAPKTGVIINQAEKTRIITTILNPISIVTITPILVDPDYVYLKFQTQADVDGKLTLFTESQIASIINNAITTYANQTFNQFGAVFAISKFGAAVDAALPAIIGSDTTVRLEKRFVPTLNTVSTYTISFATSLSRAPIQKELKSTAFTAFDSANNLRTVYLEEVFNSSTGIDSIQVTNPGYNYVSPPNVTITGDGTNANAIATIVNGTVQSITLTSRGTGYTSALVSITGGGGQGAAASAVVQQRFGTLHLFYLDSNAEKVDINPSIGTIDYDLGQVVIQDLSVAQTLSTTGDIRLSAEPELSIIETQRNQLLVLDTSDSSAILTTVTIR